MIYLRQILKSPVIDKSGEQIGVISDLGIATGEVFPRVTSLAFKGPSKTPFMISWRKYVESFDGEKVQLNVPAADIRFSYLQPEEVLLARDLLDKQIVDTQGMKVVRVNDLKLSDGAKGLRLLGAETGIRGLLWGIHPVLEKCVCGIAEALRHPIHERLIAWNYMELIEQDMSQIKLSVSHKRLHELHPADIADIIERLDPRLRGQVFAQLDEEMTVNDDEFDLVYYSYGLRLFGNMPLVEPLEYRETRKVREFVIAIDTSGSVEGALVKRFVSETYSLLKSTESFFAQVNIRIMQCDAHVQSDVAIHSAQDFDRYMDNFELRGFGGTDFRPVFQRIDEHVEAGDFENLRGLIYFTDGYGSYPQRPPDYETVFVFADEGYSSLDVPPWAMRVYLDAAFVVGTEP